MSDANEIKEKLEKIKTDHRFFDRAFGDEIDSLVEKFAWARFYGFGIQPEDFNLYIDTDYNISDGETLSGYYPEGTFPLGEYTVKVEAVEHDAKFTPDIYCSACFKLYRNGRNITNTPEALPILERFSAMYEEIASACMAFKDSMEDVYKDWVVAFAAKDNLAMKPVRINGELPV